MTPRASATQAPNMYDCMEHNEFKRFLESPASCAECADKDAIIAGLKRVSAQLGEECDRLRALVDGFKKHSHYSVPTFVCAYCEQEVPSENGAADDMPDACDACYHDMSIARAAQEKNS